jgi:hypothetical protein
MKAFLQSLLAPDRRKYLSAWLVVIVAIVVNRLAGAKGEVTLPAQLATDLVLATGGLIASVVMFAYSCWKRDQPHSRIEQARAQGRMICPCTEAGEVMVLHPQSQIPVRVLRCPKCGDMRSEGPYTVSSGVVTHDDSW